MGVELEYKMAVRTSILLEQVLFDPEIAAIRQGDYRKLNMATVYYDTPDRRFAARFWTLRLRQENDILIATVKTPVAGSGKARGEWDCEAGNIYDAIPLLLEAGAPAELADLTGDQTLLPVCAARFTRRAADVVLADGTVCELCGDIGVLVGGTKEESLCELEVELKSGSENVAAAFARELQERFNLTEEPRSKFARAAALAKECAR